MYDIIKYYKSKKRRKELLFRIGMGLQQIKYRPYYYLLLVLIFTLYGIIWCGMEIVITTEYIPMILIPLCKFAVSMIWGVTLILFSTALIRQFGIWASRSIECKIIIAFDSKDLREWGYPILISTKYEKGTNILILKFYSEIPLKRWKEKQAEIEEKTPLAILSIKYDEKENGNHKVIRAIPKGKRNNNLLRDEELDKEISNVD